MKTEITPLPWKILPDKDPNSPSIYIGPHMGYPVARLFSDANAAYIVHACNLYPELVEALNSTAKKLDRWRYDFVNYGAKLSLVSNIETVLAKCKE